MSKQSESDTDKISTAGKIIPVSLFLFCVLLAFTSFWNIPDRSLYDIFLRIKCSVTPVELTSRIVSVDLTDNAQLHLGKKIESRQAFLDTLQVMNKAGIDGCFDFLFSESKNSSIDTKIAETASGIPGSVFVAVPLSKAETGFSQKTPDTAESAALEKNLWHVKVLRAGSVPEAASFLLPYPDLAAEAPSLAHAALLPDSDGVERRAPLLYRWKDGYLPSLPLCLAARMMHADTQHIVLNAGRSLDLPLYGGTVVHIPIDNSGCMYIPYAGLWKNGLRHIPFDTFASAADDSVVYNNLYNILDGNIVFFSDITTMKKDFGTTPLESVYPLSGVHTTVLNAILTGTFFRSCPFWIRLLTAVLLTCGIVYAVREKNSRKFHRICGILFIFLTAETGIVPWYAGLCSAFLVFWLSAWLFRLNAAYQERILMEHALSRYFPRSLAARVLKEGRTDLAPAKKELTMLFSDIAGFTRWSSDKSPETVHAFLNDYLTSMAEIVFAQGGTVDKFIGDGMLAFFGDPFEQSDHTERAVNAAVNMQKKIRELAAKWKSAADIDLKVRIGINTGSVIVGNLGSDVRIDYTVIGSAVNLASRMESNAPPGGILVAETAYEKVKDKFPFSGPQKITAKGYDQPVNAYVVDETYE